MWVWVTFCGSDIKHEPSRMFINQELYGVEQPDVAFDLSKATGRCLIMNLKDYTMCELID